jgi:hypothetical protein
LDRAVNSGWEASRRPAHLSAPCPSMAKLFNTEGTENSEIGIETRGTIVRPCLFTLCPSVFSVVKAFEFGLRV